MMRPEERLQRDLVQHLRTRLPKPWLCFHIPNGGGRSKAEAGVLKAMGVLAGMPDLIVVGPRRRLHPDIFAHGADVIALELKAPPKPLKRGGVSKAKPRTSEAQDDVIAALALCGVPTLIVRDLDEALRALADLGVPLKGRVQ